MGDQRREAKISSIDQVIAKSRGIILLKYIYRVCHVASDLVLVDLDLRSSPLPGAGGAIPVVIFILLSI